MAFINIFLKTLGFFVGITTFVIIINVLYYLIPKVDNDYIFVDGNMNSENLIVQLDLSGPIFNNSIKTLTSGIYEYIDPTEVENYLDNLEKINPKVLVIRLNSPGGTVSATVSLEKKINEFKNKKNVQIYFFSEKVLASGAYWVATSGDKIFTNYGAVVGSIGVSGPSWYYYDKPVSISTGAFGKKIETLNQIQIFDQNAGRSKDLFNPYRKPSKKELEHLQNMVKEIYNDFLIKVSKNRKIEVNTLINEIGALIYTSNQAKERFLIDDVLEYNELLDKIIKNNNFKDYKLLKLNKSNNFLDKYLVNFFEINKQNLCNQLNSSFVSITPLFFNDC